MFQLHDRLAADTVILGKMKLCLLLLSRCATFPWLILVPMRPDVREIYELDREDYIQLVDEIASVSKLLQRETNCDKINIAALGNQVPQLHVHIIARFQDDAAWPQPIWCYPEMQFQKPFFLSTEIARLKRQFANLPDFQAAIGEV